VGCIILTSAVTLICFQIFQGVGSAAIYCVGTAILTSVFPSGELRKTLGINLAAIYVGYCAGTRLGGYLTHHFGSRSIFFVNVFVEMLKIPPEMVC
jgi:MFS family permease